MATIKAPNSEYNGTSASVEFVNGEGHTSNQTLLAWFRKHGYEVVDDVKTTGKKTAVLPAWDQEAESVPEWVPEAPPDKPARRQQARKQRRKEG